MQYISNANFSLSRATGDVRICEKL